MDTKRLLGVMKMITWVLFVSTCIKAGVLIISTGVSLINNPQAASDLYLGLDLSALYNYSTGHFVIFLGLMILTVLLKAYFFLLVIKIFSRINLDNPFSLKVTNLLSTLAYAALITGIVALGGDIYVDRFAEMGIPLSNDWGSAAFLYMSGILFIVTLLFRRGLEIKNENDLTI